jgi:hypothetical protein
MNAGERALKKQVRKAQALIQQFEDGTGRRNSNLAEAGREKLAWCFLYSATLHIHPPPMTQLVYRGQPDDVRETVRLLALQMGNAFKCWRATNFQTELSSRGAIFVGVEVEVLLTGNFHFCIGPVPPGSVQYPAD